MTQRFEAILAVYGIPDTAGNVLTRQAAERMAEQAKTRILSYYPHNRTFPDGSISVQPIVEGLEPGQYRIIETRIEGDAQQGRILAVSERVSA